MQRTHRQSLEAGCTNRNWIDRPNLLKERMAAAENPTLIVSAGKNELFTLNSGLKTVQKRLRGKWKTVTYVSLHVCVLFFFRLPDLFLPSSHRPSFIGLFKHLRLAPAKNVMLHRPFDQRRCRVHLHLSCIQAETIPSYTSNKQTALSPSPSPPPHTPPFYLPLSSLCCWVHRLKETITPERLAGAKILFFVGKFSKILFVEGGTSFRRTMTVPHPRPLHNTFVHFFDKSQRIRGSLSF